MLNKSRRSPGIKVTLCQVLRGGEEMSFAGSLGEDLSSREHVWHVGETPGGQCLWNRV